MAELDVEFVLKTEISYKYVNIGTQFFSLKLVIARRGANPGGTNKGGGGVFAKSEFAVFEQALAKAPSGL